MKSLKLALFALRNYAAYAQNRAGAEMFGGEVRRQRVAVHRDLTVEAVEALKAEAKSR